MAAFPRLEYLALAVGTFFLWRLVLVLQRSSSRRRLVASKHCQAPANVLARWPHQYIAFMRRMAREIKQQRVPQMFTALFQDVGATTFTVLGGKISADQHFTIDPVIVKDILSAQFSNFPVHPYRRPAYVPMLGNGIFAIDGKAWTDARALLRPQFSKKQLADLHSTEKHTTILLESIFPDGARANTLDLQPLFFRYTQDNTTEVLLGDASAESHDASAPEQGGLSFAEAITLAQDVCQWRADYGVYVTRFLHPDYKRFHEALRVAKTLVEHHVRRALREREERLKNPQKQELKESAGPERYVFLNELVDITQDVELVRDHALNILFAGRDSTASLLGFVMYSLARYPRVFNKLREEVVGTLGEGAEAALPDYETMKDMHYLQLVIRETLRLFPIVPLNGRTSDADTTIPAGGGPDGTAPILLKKGDRVTWSVYDMHRRKDVYGPDADQFRPERWEEPSMRSIGWGYIPFGGGPRICLGQQRALNEASYVTARIAQTCASIAPADAGTPVGASADTAPRFAFALIMNLADGARVSVVKA